MDLIVLHDLYELILFQNCFVFNLRSVSISVSLLFIKCNDFKKLIKNNFTLQFVFYPNLWININIYNLHIYQGGLFPSQCCIAEVVIKEFLLKGELSEMSMLVGLCHLSFACNCSEENLMENVKCFQRQFQVL